MKRPHELPREHGLPAAHIATTRGYDTLDNIAWPLPSSEAFSFNMASLGSEVQHGRYPAQRPFVLTWPDIRIMSDTRDEEKDRNKDQRCVARHPRSKN